MSCDYSKKGQFWQFLRFDFSRTILKACFNLYFLYALEFQDQKICIKYKYFFLARCITKRTVERARAYVHHPSIVPIRSVHHSTVLLSPLKSHNRNYYCYYCCCYNYHYFAGRYTYYNNNITRSYGGTCPDPAQTGLTGRHRDRVSRRRNGLHPDRFHLRGHDVRLVAVRAQRVLRGHGVCRGRLGAGVRGPPAVHGQEGPIFRPRQLRRWPIRFQDDRLVCKVNVCRYKFNIIRYMCEVLQESRITTQDESFILLFII